MRNATQRLTSNFDGPLRRLHTAILSLVITAVSGGVIYTLLVNRGAQLDSEDLESSSSAFRDDRAPLPSHQQTSYELAQQTVKVDVAGIVRPHIVPAASVELDLATQVIGVVVEDQARAYVIRAFEVHGRRGDSDLAVHLVYDQINGQNLCVTHCDRTRATRVLLGDPNKEPSELAQEVRVGGWNNGLMLRVRDQEFRIDSAEIPLEDLNFVVTTWSEWLQEHPTTMVYLGKPASGETYAP